MHAITAQADLLREYVRVILAPFSSLSLIEPFTWTHAQGFAIRLVHLCRRRDLAYSRQEALGSLPKEVHFFVIVLAADQKSEESWLLYVSLSPSPSELALLIARPWTALMQSRRA